MKQTLYDLSKKQKLPKPMPVYSMPEMTSQLKPGRIYRHLSSLFISLDCGVCLVMSSQDVEAMIKDGILKPDVMIDRTMN